MVRIKKYKFRNSAFASWALARVVKSKYSCMYFWKGIFRFYWSIAIVALIIALITFALICACRQHIRKYRFARIGLRLLYFRRQHQNVIFASHKSRLRSAKLNFCYCKHNSKWSYWILWTKSEFLLAINWCYG